VELAAGGELEAEIGGARRIDAAAALAAPPALIAADASNCGGEDERSAAEPSEAEMLNEAAGGAVA
jgi:hypothetical protein